MRLPRIILNPSVAGWIRLWQRERRLNTQLRRERDEWANKFLQAKNTQPLFTPPPKIEVTERPPVGPIAKKLALAQREKEVNIPTAEQVLGI